MKSKQILFFATRTDIEPIIMLVEASFSIRYFEMGLFDSKDINSYNSVFEISDFGFAKSGDWNKDLRLMAMPQALHLSIREVPQKLGGFKYAIDPVENHNSICFQFGGTFKEGILVGGNCFTTNPNTFALDIFKLVSSKIRKEFKKIGLFYVGKDAEEKLKMGWRLVTNEKMSKEHDLAL